VQEWNGPAGTPGSVQVTDAEASDTVGGHLSRDYVAAALQRSTRELSEQLRRSLSDLAPDEVYPADRSPESLVVSYTTVSPLPGLGFSKEPVVPAVYSLLHCLADCSGWVLPTVLPCGARTFLGDHRQRETRASGDG
jgi:hypothetical protein